MDIINDAAATQTLVGSSKRRLPSSCAADYRVAHPIEKDLKRKRRRAAAAAGFPVIAQKTSASVVSKLAQYKPDPEYQFEIQNPTAGVPQVSDRTVQVTEISSLYTSSSAYNIAAPSPIAQTPLSSSSTSTDLFTDDRPGQILPPFITEQPPVSAQATVTHGTGVPLHSSLRSGVNPIEEHGRILNRHIDLISPDTCSWITSTEALPTVYDSGVLATLQDSPSELDLSHNLAFSTPDYQLQSSHRPIEQQSEDILRYPCYMWQAAPWSLPQPIPILGQSPIAPQLNMAITRNPVRVAIPSHLPLEKHFRDNNPAKEQEQLEEQSDADYVIVGSADSTPSGSHKDVSQLGKTEDLADLTTVHPSQTSLDTNTSPQLSSWNMVIALPDPDECSPSRDECCDTCHDQATTIDTNKATLPREDTESSVGSSKAPKRRQTFNEIDRQETSRTRNSGACVRCKMQRIRCKENPADPEGPCMTCLTVSKTSKKVIHHVPCVRWKLQEITLFRTSGLGITKRWEGVTIRDVDFADAPGFDVRAIQMEQGLCSEPLCFDVRRFKPRPGDVLYRKWYDKDEKIYKTTDLTPYALADIHKTKETFVKYIDQHALECLKSFVNNTNNDVLGRAEDVVRDTYRMAYDHLQSLGDDDQHADEKLLLVNLFRFWFALRHTTGSSWIAGEERLDMTPVTDPSYPTVLHGKISTPRMIIAQFDSINTQYVLKILAKRILEKLEKFMKTKNTNRYLTIFVSCFILLHEISHMTEDRYRHGRANGVEGGYSLPFFVRDLQDGANVILIHWHYYNSGLDPLTMDWNQRHKTPLADLSEKEVMYLITTWRRMKDREEHIRNMWATGLHFHSIYFVAQMFEPKWSTKKTFPG